MPRNSRQKRRPAEVIRDSVKISEMYRDGAYQAVIAYELGLSQSTVSRALKKLEKQWADDSTKNINEAKARELAKIDNLELVYWNAWLRSQEDAVKEVEGFNKTQGSYSSTTTEHQVGNPAFLQGVAECMKQRAAILGVEAPKKSENLFSGIDLAKLSDEQLKRIQDGEDIINVLIATSGAGRATS